MFPVTSNAVYNVVASAIPEALGSISNTEIDILFTLVLHDYMQQGF